MIGGKYKAYPEYRDSGVEWVGRIPAHWEVPPLFATVIHQPVKNEDGAEDNVLSLSYGRIIKRNIEANHGLLPASFDTYQIVKADDIVLRLTDLQNDWNSLRVGFSTQKGIITSAYLKLSVKKQILHAKFFYRLLHSYDTTKVFYGMGGGLRQSMKFGDMRRLEVILPSLSEQIQIARFLDNETGKIDFLIEKQQELIALLKEKRQAVISHAVTKGLNRQAPLKDSGIEWLGQVPEHWEIKRFKFTITEGSSGPYGSSLTKSMYTPEGVRVYGQQQVIPDDFSVGDYYIPPKKFRELQRHLVSENNMLVSVMGTIGRVAIVPKNAEKGIINPRLVKYRISEEQADPHFLKEVFHSNHIQDYFSLHSIGTTMDGLNMQIIGEAPISLPPLKEQNLILKFINESRDRMGALVTFAETQITLLNERRTALISAAVTGKIDVRDWESAKY